jgi:hypothetical protein
LDCSIQLLAAASKNEQEALEHYCAGKGLDPVRFRNEEYGPYLVVKRIIVSPGDIERDD